MKKSLLALVAVLMSVLAMAQAPQKMTYQAVVRDSNGQLVSNGNVGVRITIVRGSETGTGVYSQTETVRTNDNGLFTTMIGGTGFDAIDWGNGPYYLKSEVDPDGGSNYILTTTQQMVSVPYALHAGTVDSIIGGVNFTETDPIFNAWNKDYNDLINRPTIPTNVSELTNDAGYLTSFTETQVLSISNDTIYLTGGSYVKLPTGFSGDYNDLTNRPTIPTVPTNVSELTNDAGYLTSFTEAQVLSISNDTIYLTGGSYVKLPAGFSGDYNDLTNKPTIPTVPTNVSEFTNDAGYLTSFTEAQVLSISNDTIYLTGGSYVKLPAGFSGDYNDLTNKPTIPTVPTNVSEFTNDAGYLTSFTEAQVLSISNDTIYLTGGSYVKLPAGFSGDYNDLTNKPTIPTVPANVSEFTNDAGYLTSFTEAQVLSNSNDTIYLTGGSFVKLPAGFSGDYNDLTNKPTIPTVPTNVSEFANDAGYITATSVPTNVSELTNDAGYLTSFTEAQVLSISNDTIYLTGGSYVKLPAGFSGDYNDLTNKPTIPTVPTNVSEFTNDAGYITSAGVPTNVSEFTNDAGYLSSYTETQTLANVAALGNVVETQIKQLSDPTEDLDAVNLRTLNITISTVVSDWSRRFDSLAHRFDSIASSLDSIIAYQDSVVDTLSQIIANGSNTQTNAFDANGASIALFSVSATKQVKFSKGNLQWKPSGTHDVATGGTESGTWRFAENQWDYKGYDNQNKSQYFSDWSDLFCWATSGWKSRWATEYQPWSLADIAGAYSYYDMIGDNINSDWGVYNAISNGGNQPGLWRTLTNDEWNYLLYTRTTSTACGYENVRFVRATIVSDVQGVIIFPDEYIHPVAVTTLTNVNELNSAYSSYILTMKEWDQMQDAGCIFLPAGGNVYKTTGSVTKVSNCGIDGIYWSSIHNTIPGNTTGFALSFNSSAMGSQESAQHVHYGASVRLVQDAN